nr:hypothetical protein [Tanacetum cinerariifolium]GEV90577.1 hypothetical protein [Tanacetum cinerariifolium]
MNSSNPSLSCRPTKVEVSKELLKVSMVNTSLKKLKHHLEGFDVLVKERTTATAIKEGSDDSFSNQNALSFDQYFKLNELKAQSQEKDTVISKLKERLKSLSGNINKDKVKKDIEEIETINIELNHRVSKLIAENEHLKQTHKQLYDSIKPTRVRSKEQSLKNELRKLQRKALVDNAAIIHTIAPEMLNVDMEPLAPRLLNNRTVHSDYLKLTQEQSMILWKVVITTTTEVPLRKQTTLEIDTPKPVATLVYSRKPRKFKTSVPVSKPKIIKSISANNKEPSKSWGSIIFDVPSSSLDEYRNDHMAKIMGYGDYQIRNVMISRVYYVEGLGHNLFSASKTKPWLWHRRLSHLNFGAINHLARHGLVRGLPKLKFEKDHLYIACTMGKSKKKSHKPKSEDTNQEKLYRLHMDLCGPMRVASVNGKKYILVIVDDYYRFTSIKCLRTDNGTEFVNQTLHEYYENVGISHETSVARSPQQNSILERRNHTLIDAARAMLIYAKASLFLWTETVATTCYTQNHSIIRLRHGKTPYELLHDKLLELSFFYVFGVLCYLTNDSENLGKLQPKADIGSFVSTKFDELLTRPPSVDLPAPKVIALIAKVVALGPAASTGSSSSTTVDQDEPSPSNSQTSIKTQSPVISNDVEEENHDLDVAHVNNDSFFGILIPENNSESSSLDVIPTIVHPAAPNSEHIKK